MIIGYLIDSLLSHSSLFLTKLNWTLPNTRTNFITGSVLLLLGGVCIYYGLIMIGLDPNFSVALATKFCQERLWVHPDTTPFYSLMRSSGALLGMGVVASLASGKWVHLVNIERQWTRKPQRIGTKISGLIFSLFVVTLLHSKYTPSLAQSGDVVLYAEAFLKTSMIPCVVFLISCSKLITSS